MVTGLFFVSTIKRKIQINVNFQLVGFVVLLYGMFLYNGITLMGPFVSCWSKIRNPNYGNIQEENAVENYDATADKSTSKEEPQYSIISINDANINFQIDIFLDIIVILMIVLILIL